MCSMERVAVLIWKAMRLVLFPYMDVRNWAGEQALMEVCPDSVIIRTAWLYSEYGNNFMKTVLRLGKERDELRFILTKWVRLLMPEI